MRHESERADERVVHDLEREPENGASSEHGRLSSSSAVDFDALDGGTSSGDGRKSTTASSMG
jgi:hypothetical protein